MQCNPPPATPEAADEQGPPRASHRHPRRQRSLPGPGAALLPLMVLERGYGYGRERADARGHRAVERGAAAVRPLCRPPSTALAGAGGLPGRGAGPGAGGPGLALPLDLARDRAVRPRHRGLPPSAAVARARGRRRLAEGDERVLGRRHHRRLVRAGSSPPPWSAAARCARSYLLGLPALAMGVVMAAWPTAARARRTRHGPARPGARRPRRSERRTTGAPSRCWWPPSSAGRSLRDGAVDAFAAHHARPARLGLPGRGGARPASPPPVPWAPCWAAGSATASGGWARSARATCSRCRPWPGWCSRPRLPGRWPARRCWSCACSCPSRRR